jgi:hypothetical protein
MSRIGGRRPTHLPPHARLRHSRDWKGLLLAGFAVGILGAGFAVMVTVVLLLRGG